MCIYRCSLRGPTLPVGLEIKELDDDIADCTQHVEQERRSERSAEYAKKLQPASK